MAEPGKADWAQWKLYQEHCELVILHLDPVNTTQNLLVGAACLSLAELGRCGPLPLPDSGPDTEPVNKLGLVTKLLGMVKSNKAAMKVRERAALAVGSLCLGDSAFPHRRLLLE